ncbi:hypothetical protein E3N88_12853 [Mikania micrantha]|uniref:Reverse transcriptase Ty1/copia-type domain-containing protein n=1 Tax=Mikania micrantha TaxID=192012 RepID=A0A5N6P8Q1_9ASTR|nr:hypothetical protein E3N88_12853 [Mikania micrantha]
MKDRFEMSDMGLLTYYLGIEVKQDRAGIFLKQEGYCRKILKEVNLLECNPSTFPLDPGLKLGKDEDQESVNATEYRRIIGCLRYLTHTRPDICYAVGYGVHYSRNGAGNLEGYSDSSHATDQGLLEEITGQSVKAITLHVDNKSAIQLMKNPVFHGRSKHIDTRYHFIRECVEEELVKIEHVSEEKQKADILTKALSRIKFAEMRSLIGVEDLENKKTEIKGVNVS